jgi:hypothetical protein
MATVIAKSTNVAKTFWNKQAASYVDKSGKVIDHKDVRAAVDAVADDASVRLRSIYNANKASISEWVSQSESLLKKLYGSTAQIASGGREAMTPSLNGQLGARTRYHLGKFKGFWLEVEQGKLSEAQILARLDLYADASVRIFGEIHHNVQISAGNTIAENILDDGAQHCKTGITCPGLTAKGKVPASEMPPPGNRGCGNKCRCRVVYSRPE